MPQVGHTLRLFLKIFLISALMGISACEPSTGKQSSHGGQIGGQGSDTSTGVGQGTEGDTGASEGSQSPQGPKVTATGNPAGSKEPIIPAIALPDLTLMSDEVFQRNAKMGRLVARQRCILCHKIEGRGAILQPPLVQVSMRRLKRMLTYDKFLEELKISDPDRFHANNDKFLAIKEEEDVLKSMKLWLRGYLKQPTFDNSQAKMPLQVLRPAEIEQLACYVIQLAVEGYQTGETPLED